MKTLLLGMVAGLTIWMGLGGASWASQADLVVVGPVVTMAASRPYARGLAVAGGKIVFVGDAASARKLLRSGGRLIALEPGQVVIPGLVDAHNHMMDAGLMRQRCALDMPGGACGGAKNKVDALEMIAKYSKAHPDLPGKWVIGSGWSGDWDWANRQLGPSAAELDAVVADRPAVFYDDNGHSAWLNSLALDAAKRLLATFGEVERISTSTREMEKLSPSDGAVFPTLLRTGKRGETSKPP